MILEDELAAIVAKQRELEVKMSIGQMRPLEFNDSLLDSHVLDITGVRRCGKSTVMRQRMRGLDEPWFYVNFESPLLTQFEMRDTIRLDSLIEKSGARRLFFDEIDGLLRDRSSADHGWEVTQVNELLQQMENFDGIMVAATNFSKNLDPATMRRFTFKVEFGYLEDAGKRLFFERMFKVSLAEDEFSELRQLHNLTPGDFRTVRQSQYYLGYDITNADRIAALKEECDMKKDGFFRNPIGFM